ncbi:hypothetical protein BU23DRAFT_566034 [Bimuria novae-zelandiae CBS 107.79]|uniref:Uncharacterized protein n=1 Tax=Bimuria novae-zelandiae CBS 107.79 TaxID=1447943 RepID=A0A6A5VIW1_9PLEO|nr:hypothetical protein BU23DRAFT_566034 [Bimuria novae-zelandiae CBS 107.79]
MTFTNRLLDSTHCFSVIDLKPLECLDVGVRGSALVQARRLRAEEFVDKVSISRQNSTAATTTRSSEQRPYREFSDDALSGTNAVENGDADTTDRRGEQSPTDTAAIEKHPIRSLDRYTNSSSSRQSTANYRAIRYCANATRRFGEPPKRLQSPPRRSPRYQNIFTPKSLVMNEHGLGDNPASHHSPHAKRAGTNRNKGVKLGTTPWAQRDAGSRCGSSSPGAQWRQKPPGRRRQICHCRSPRYGNAWRLLALAFHAAAAVGTALDRGPGVHVETTSAHPQVIGRGIVTTLSARLLDY